MIYLPGGGTVLLRSRSGADITPAYPELAGLGAALGSRPAVLDGEVVALDGEGCSDFERLQSRMGLAGSPARAARMAKEIPVHLMRFDVPFLDAWWVPDGRHSDQPHPPLLLVFNRIGPRNPNTVIAQLAELTERHWKGTWYDASFHMYDGKLPIVVTGMKQLQEHGPAGAVFRRFGRRQNQTLLEAIGNSRREAHDARKQAEYTARQREHKEELRRIAAQHRAEKEARRPV